MTKRIAIASFLLCLLAACGNKGPLVMPSPASASAPAPVVPETPADTPTTEPASDDGTPARH